MRASLTSRSRPRAAGWQRSTSSQASSDVSNPPTALEHVRADGEVAAAEPVDVAADSRVVPRSMS